MRGLWLLSRQLGVELPDQSFHRPPCRRGPDSIDFSLIAADAREFVLELTNKVQIRETSQFRGYRCSRQSGGPPIRDIDRLRNWSRREGSRRLKQVTCTRLIDWACASVVERTTRAHGKSGDRQTQNDQKIAQHPHVPHSNSAVAKTRSPNHRMKARSTN
jgi:hypothetical protein